MYKIIFADINISYILKKLAGSVFIKFIIMSGKAYSFTYIRRTISTVLPSNVFKAFFCLDSSNLQCDNLEPVSYTHLDVYKRQDKQNN